MNSFNAIETQKRLGVVDALRGFALLAILVANLPIAENSPVSFPASDRVLIFLFHLLIDKKFVAIFSMLFGFGFFIQMKNAAEKGIAFRRYFFFRMLLLLLIGCLHAYLLWFGDIIRDYAIGGMFLLFMYKWSARRILVTGIILVALFTPLIFILNGVLEMSYDFNGNYAAQHPLVSTYSEYLTINFRIDPFRNFVQDSPLTLVFALGSMLIGFWMAKSGFFQQPEKFKRVRNRLIIPGIITGLPCSYLFWKISTGELALSTELIWLPFVIVAGLFLQSLLYIAVFMRLKKWPAGFQYVGRMALTNYILQSVFYIICFFHFSGLFQWYGKLGVTATYFVAILLFTLQILISRLWLKKFSQGPVEYIWKKIAYKFIRPSTVKTGLPHL